LLGHGIMGRSLKQSEWLNGEKETVIKENANHAYIKSGVDKKKNMYLNKRNNKSMLQVCWYK